MKKLLFIFVLIFMVFGVLACSNEPTIEEEHWNIVMITDVGTITDKSFNQGTWEGVKAFAVENDIPYMYFRPNESTNSEYEAAIDLLVDNGANVIVTPGFLFETAIYNKQMEYPDVKFILIDGEPNDGEGNYHTSSNTTNILFKEEQAGFLAGYAAVADGFTSLGFMGGMELPSVQRYGIGYISGAYYAANELGYTILFPADRYIYLGTFERNSNQITLATEWYNSGTEIIFASAGSAGQSVMAAAEGIPDAKVIGVDVDQADDSSTVISSAIKRLAVAVQQELTAIILEGQGNGGTTLVKGVREDAVGLSTGESFKWENFTNENYQEIYGLIEDGTIIVPTTDEELNAFLEDQAGNPDIDDLIDKTIS